MPQPDLAIRSLSRAIGSRRSVIAYLAESNQVGAQLLAASAAMKSEMSELDAIFNDLGIPRRIQLLITVRQWIEPVEWIGDDGRIEAFAYKVHLALLEGSRHLNLRLQSEEYGPRIG